MATTTKPAAPVAKKTAAKKAPAKKPPVAKSVAKKSSAAKTSSAAAGASGTPSAHIDARIASLPDWRGPMLAQLRAAIRAADPGVIEEWKWNVPVWSCDGILCTGETYKNVVKLTFAKGAALPDPKRLFNSSLEGNVRRAIDVREGAAPDTAALQALVRAAVAHNRATKRG